MNDAIEMHKKGARYQLMDAIEIHTEGAMYWLMVSIDIPKYITWHNLVDPMQYLNI